MTTYTPTGPSRPRVAELVAAKLRVRIVTGDLQDGDELPRESDLLEEFEVSRPSLREAVRILETEGLLRIRRGKVGGAIVSRPSAESAAYHLGLALQACRTTLGDVAAAREVLGPTCAALVAGLPDSERRVAVAELTAVVDRNEADLADDYAFTAGALAFHTALVDLCGNTTVAMLTSSLEVVWSAQARLWAAQASVQGDYPEVELRREVIRAHRVVIGAIEVGDPAAAHTVMCKHLAKAQPYVDREVEVVSTRD